MSYSLGLFDVQVAPADDEQFRNWVYDQLNNEKASIDNSVVSSKPLKEAYAELKVDFPPMNGPEAIPAEEWPEDKESYISDYTFNESIIYIDVAWTVSDEALKKIIALAEKYKVGIFDPLDAGTGRFIMFEEEASVPQSAPEEKTVPKTKVQSKEGLAFVSIFLKIAKAITSWL